MTSAMALRFDLVHTNQVGNIGLVAILALGLGFRVSGLGFGIWGLGLPHTEGLRQYGGNIRVFLVVL